MRSVEANSLRAFIVTGSVVLAVATLYWAQKVLIPVALAILLSFLLAPFVIMLQRRGVPRLLSVLIAVTVALIVLGGVGSAIVLQLGRLVQELPQYKQNISAKIAGIHEVAQGTVFEHLQDLADDLTAEWNLTPTPGPLTVRIEPSGVSQVLAAAGPATEFFAQAAFVFVLVIFTLIQREDLRNRLVRLMGRGQLVTTTRAIDEASHRISRFLLTQLLVNAGFGIALAIGLLCLGMPYALLWGGVGTLVRFIPYVGVWGLAALLSTFSIVIFPGWGHFIGVMALFLGLELGTSQFMEPLVFGHSTGISTVALLVAAAFWAWLWGPIGLILSTPLTACLVVIGRYSPSLEFLDVLLSDPLEFETHLMFYQRLLARDQDEAAELIENALADRSAEAVIDQVLVPALVLANRDVARGELTDEDYDDLLQATRTVVEHLLTPTATAISTGPNASAPGQPLVLATPAHGAGDELALHLFCQVMEPAGMSLEVVSSDVLNAEMIDRIRRERPLAIFIAALPPGGVTATRYLAKRIRQQARDVRICVGVWGSEESKTHLAERLGTAVSQVGISVAESRAQLLPLLQLCTAATTSEKVRAS